MVSEERVRMTSRWGGGRGHGAVWQNRSRDGLNLPLRGSSALPLRRSARPDESASATARASPRLVRFFVCYYSHCFVASQSDHSSLDSTIRPNSDFAAAFCNPTGYIATLTIPQVSR